MSNHNKCICKLPKRILYKIKDHPAPLYPTIAINMISTLARIIMLIMRDTWLKKLTILGGRIMFKVIEEGLEKGDGVGQSVGDGHRGLGVN